MSHSNSSLNCFAACMAKYKHAYVDHTPPCKPVSPHLTFGVMAHDTLYKAGMLRDNDADKVLDTDEYSQVIPSEVLYDDLKTYFKIDNWYNYFMPIIKRIAEYEKELVTLLAEDTHESVSIEREIKLQLTVDQLHQLGYYKIDQPIVGIIDCLIYTKTSAIIIDYKFSSKKKTQDDFDMNSQLPLYALFVHILYDIPVHNIRVGYVDIPKVMFDKPLLLSNGTLSRSKSQNVSQDEYKRWVNAIHGTWYDANDNIVDYGASAVRCKEHEYYNCNEDGYYFEVYTALSLNQPAYLSVQYINIDTYIGVTKDLFDAAQLLDTMRRENLTFAKKYDAYSCKDCEFLNACKPWLII